MALTRTVNSKFLAWSLGTLAVFSVAVYFVHGYQVKRHANVFKQQAEDAAGQKEFVKACETYPIYLRYVPDDIDARIAYCAALDSLKRTPYNVLYVQYEE